MLGPQCIAELVKEVLPFLGGLRIVLRRDHPVHLSVQRDWMLIYFAPSVVPALQSNPYTNLADSFADSPNQLDFTQRNCVRRLLHDKFNQKINEQAF